MAVTSMTGRNWRVEALIYGTGLIMLQGTAILNATITITVSLLNVRTSRGH